jgi:ribose 5-phosphate isomerase A
MAAEYSVSTDDPAKDARRRRAAEAALSEVRGGMRVGLGTGRAAAHFVRGLGALVHGGLDIRGVPTSKATAALADEVGVPLVSEADGVGADLVDLVVDGADEIDRRLRMIKGGGGALLREKIVATSAKRVVVVAEEEKLVERLGAFPLPIEIVRFGAEQTCERIVRAAAALGLAADVRLRGGESGPFVTDGGNHVVDVVVGEVPDPGALATALDAITGVVEHGLFLGLAAVAYLGTDRGVAVLSAEPQRPA